MELNEPRPIRRLSPGAAVSPRPPVHEPSANGNGHAPSQSPFVTARRAARATAATLDRMQVEELSIAYGSKLAVKSVSSADSPGRGAGADRTVRVR